MADRKNGGRNAGQTGRGSSSREKGGRRFPAGVIFWTLFLIVMTGLFLANRGTIKKNFAVLTRRLNFSAAGVPLQADEKDAAAESGRQDSPQTQPDGGGVPVITVTQLPAEKPPAQTVSEPDSRPSTEKPVQPKPPDAKPAAKQPAAKPAQTAVPQAAAKAPEKPAAALRERNIYFTRIDNDGAILRSRVTRKLSASDSPMLDALAALLSGPTPEERRRGMISLIPANTRILSATVRGNTAYISFNEDFQYNTYGVEGYAGQVRQIVWTATEFPNVADVQILIEGRRIDFLGEGIWIGSPIGRDSL